MEKKCVWGAGVGARGSTQGSLKSKDSGTFGKSTGIEKSHDHVLTVEESCELSVREGCHSVAISSVSASLRISTVPNETKHTQHLSLIHI